MEKTNFGTYLSALLSTVSGIIVAWANKYPDLAMEILAIVLISLGLLLFAVCLFNELKARGSTITEMQYYLTAALIVVAVWTLFVAAGDMRKTFKAVEVAPGRWQIVEE